jgi:hypothetical protein
MRPISVTVLGVAVSAPIPLDIYANPTTVALGVVMVGGATYTVQHTFDDVFALGYVPASGTWFDHPVLDGLGVSSDGNYGFPPRAIRLNVTAADSAAEGAILNVIQAGGTSGS